MLMSMLMSHASVDLFVLSFVLPCAYAYAYVAINIAVKQACFNHKEGIKLI